MHYFHSLDYHLTLVDTLEEMAFELDKMTQVRCKLPVITDKAR